MQVVIFDTEEQAETQQALDLIEHLKFHTNPEYQAGTTRWAVPRERLDGKWDYPACSHQDYTGMLVEEYDSANYPVVEEQEWMI